MKGLAIAQGMAARGVFMAAVRYLMAQNPGLLQWQAREALKK